MFCTLMALAFLQSCKNKEQQAAENTKVPTEKYTSSACYKAVYDKDTVALRLNTLQTGKISGSMLMKMENQPAKDGKISGEFRGDTLFADYTFVLGGNTKTTFRNPMAFLKKGNQLVLGNGQIQTTMGASYFVKGKPIDFEHVKYKFDETPCAGK